MRTLLLWAAALAASTLCAQTGGGFMDYQRQTMVSPTMLMQQGDFRNDLKLDKEQSKVIGELTKEYQKRLNEASRGATNPSRRMVELEKSRAETDAKILEQFRPEQKVRFRQLQWQCLGYKALYEEDLQKQLALTEEQVGKLKEFESGESARMLEAMQKGRGTGSGIKKLKEESAKTTMGFLTPDQIAALKAALGKENKSAKRMSEAVY
jgi:hypothetical protein